MTGGGDMTTSEPAEFLRRLADLPDRAALIDQTHDYSAPSPFKPDRGGLYPSLEEMRRRITRLLGPEAADLCVAFEEHMQWLEITTHLGSAR